MELTKAGTPHLHIIADVPFISQRWLSAAWNELTGARVVDIRVVKSRKGVGGYLTSYLTKALEVPEGHRKWSAARGFVPPEEPPELAEGEIRPEYVFRPVTIEILERAFISAGYERHGDWLHPPGWNPRVRPEV